MASSRSEISEISESTPLIKDDVIRKINENFHSNSNSNSDTLWFERYCKNGEIRISFQVGFLSDFSFWGGPAGEPEFRINIGLLNKCTERSGSDTLREMIEIGKACNIVAITLGDGSHLEMIDENGEEFLIDFAILHILMNGISWYNKFGFVSKTHEQEIFHNEMIINGLFNELISPESFSQIFPEISPEMTISDAVNIIYIKYIKGKEKINKNVRTCVENIIKLTKKKIKYSGNLRKVLIE